MRSGNDRCIQKTVCIDRCGGRCCGCVSIHRPFRWRHSVDIRTEGLEVACIKRDPVANHWVVFQNVEAFHHRRNSVRGDVYRSVHGSIANTGTGDIATHMHRPRFITAGHLVDDLNICGGRTGTNANRSQHMQRSACIHSGQGPNITS